MEVADKGLGVSVLCPGLVKTNLLDAEQVRPKALKTGNRYDVTQTDVASGINPDDVGKRVVEAIIDNEFYIFTHNDYRDIVKMRFDGILDAMDRQTAI